MSTMSEDAKAIVLLCGRLGNSSGAAPLRQREYGVLVRWLINEELRPADLLDAKLTTRAALETRLDEQRLSSLLGRGVQLGFAVEKWNQSGLWVICRSDPDYPARLKEHLRDKAPPILFGAGDRALLPGGGLAIVGSRDVDDSGQQFTRDVASWCAHGGMNVVSGGARGVDRIAMSVAVDAGGAVICVLADSLLKQSVARDSRQALADGRLLLISPYHPEARFHVGSAMGRNKFIYAMSDYGLVVSAIFENGGTWSGAVEELKRNQPRPMFVRTVGTLPSGNQRLLPLGAVAFPEWTQEDDPATVLDAASVDVAMGSGRQSSLFESKRTRSSTPNRVEERSEWSAEKQQLRASPSPDAGELAAAPQTVYDAILPLLLAALDDATGLPELAERLGVAKGQLQSWLQRAIDDKQVRKLTGPARYIRRNASDS